MKKSILPTLFSVLIVFFLANLHSKGEISTLVFILLCFVAIIFFQALFYYINSIKSSKAIKKLQKHAGLIVSNPDEYLKMCDELMYDKKGSEYDYLILHKANVLARLKRNKEAIKLMSKNVPYYLDDTNAGIYYTNLIGLYIKEGDFKSAKNILDSNKEILKKLESHKTRGYSIMVNKASIFHHFGDNKRALEEAKKALALTNSDEMKKEIGKFISKLENE